jgi:hypothetical protein
MHDGYGSAEPVPSLLTAAEEYGSDQNGPWDELWARLYHQGTVYSASYATLPALARMSQQHPPSGYVAALHLAAAIVASTDGPTDAATVRLHYTRELSSLRIVAAANLRHAEDDTDFLYGLQALMAFEDGGVWQRHLCRLADGELEVDCPACDEHLLVNLDLPVATAESFADGSLPPTTLTRISEPVAATVEARLLALARANDRPRVADKLPYLFGTVDCPRCHVSFQISDALA